MMGSSEDTGFAGIVGRHPSMQAIFEIIRRVAPTNTTVLITGESGTGKELVAAALHALSKRAEGRFVPVHCGAIPEDLLESEMFGHERGAFTGAVASRIGRFKLADAGTIFLDEIGEMSPKLQVKLLRALEDGRFEPVGGTTTQEVDVRIIAATNRTLEKAVAQREFREDLYYRLRVVPIEVPPLRERRDDIPLLVEHTLVALAKQGHRRFTVAESALAAFQRYAWPGNVRELCNLLEQLVVLGRPEGVIEAFDLPAHVTAPAPLAAGNAAPWDFGPDGVDFYGEIEAIEDRMIAHALQLSGGNKKEAARLLRLNRTTLLEKLKRKRQIGSPLAALFGEPRRAAPARASVMDDGMVVPPAVGVA